MYAAYLRKTLLEEKPYHMILTSYINIYVYLHKSCTTWIE